MDLGITHPCNWSREYKRNEMFFSLAPYPNWFCMLTFPLSDGDYQNSDEQSIRIKRHSRNRCHHRSLVMKWGKAWEERGGTSASNKVRLKFLSVWVWPLLEDAEPHPGMKEPTEYCTMLSWVANQGAVQFRKTSWLIFALLNPLAWCFDRIHF